MEDKLDEWTQELREAGCCVSGFTLKVKAIQILRELAQYNGTFSASDGWLRGFLRRKNFTLRRITTTGRDLPSDFLETIDQFLKDCKINFIDDDEFDPHALIQRCVLKVNRALQQSKIVRLSRSARNLFTFNGANNVVNESDSDTDVQEGNTNLFQDYLNIFS